LVWLPAELAGSQWSPLHKLHEQGLQANTRHSGRWPSVSAMAATVPVCPRASLC